MESSAEIKTPFLQYCVAYYSNLGIHLLKINCTNVYSLFHVFKNVFIDLATIYVLISMDIFKQFTTKMTQRKPLFGIFVNFALRYIIPFVFITENCYFFAVGYKIISKLDSKPLRQVFKNKKLAQQIFIIIFIIDVIRFVIFSYFVILTVFVRSNSFWYNVLCSVCIHLLTYYQYLPCLMVHYFQLGILKNLKIVEKSHNFHGKSL